MSTKKSQIKRFSKVLIANRGEIALRIIRTLREMGIGSILIYAPDDAKSLALKYADYGWPLKGQTSGETYLNIAQIIEAVKETGADAVHPGYGFLSESPEFCRAVEEAGAVFIGPGPESMSLMGDKIKAKELMTEHGVPVLPGSDGAVTDSRQLHALAESAGFPLILKAAAGGGGRGMRIVHEPGELDDALAACQREALTWFGNGAVFCEKYVANPRHIEFQVLWDTHGNGVHLFERDCSIQRRHQKLFEEAPSGYLSPEQRENLGQLALRASAAAGYVGAGTIEFICESPDKAWFMEMNTRIQVEHPVTEMITGLDLIKEQICIAQGQELSVRQDQLRVNGWSMEARINCEDPGNNFSPSPGKIENVTFPQGAFIRTDSAVYSGYEIPSGYDSMLAKIIVWGRDRQEAAERLVRALSESSFAGIKTTIPFHEALLRHPEFLAGNFDTHFCKNREEEIRKDLSGARGRLEEDDLALAALISSLTDSPALPAMVDHPEDWNRSARLESVHQRY